MFAVLLWKDVEKCCRVRGAVESTWFQDTTSVFVLSQQRQYDDHTILVSHEPIVVDTSVLSTTLQCLSRAEAGLKGERVLLVPGSLAVTGISIILDRSD